MDAETRHRTLQLLGIENRAIHPKSNPAPGRQVISAEGAHKYDLPIGATIVPGRQLLASAEAIARWNHDLGDKHDLVVAVESGARSAGPMHFGSSDRVLTRLGDFGNGEEHLVTTYLGDEAQRYADSDQLASALGRSIGLDSPRMLRVAQDRTVSDLVDGPTWAEREQHILTDERGYTRTGGGGKWQDKARRDMVRQRDNMLASDAGTRMGVFDLLVGVDVRDPGTVVLSADGPVPVQTENGWTATAGRTAVHTAVQRQKLPGIKMPKGVKLVDVSHETPHPGSTPPRPTKAEAAAGLVTWQAFARGGAWQDNPLTAADVAHLRQQLDAVRPEFEARQQMDWWQFASDRLDALAAHATGTVDLFAPAA